MLNGGAIDLQRFFGRANGYLIRKLESKPKLLKAMMNFMADEVVTNDPYSGLFSLPPWGSRSLWVRGHHHEGGRRDLDGDCGYPDETELDPQWYKRAYGRWGLAARVVDIWPDECWAAKPQIYQNEKPGDTPWDKAVEKVWRKVMMDHYLWRVDRLSGICQFGVLFYGLDDGGRLDRPPAGIHPDTGEPLDPNNPPKHQLLYVRSFDQTLVRVAQTDKNPRSPRFGRPKQYAVLFYDGAIAGTGSGVPDGQKPLPLAQSRVHWTRMQHVQDNPMTSEVFGTPRLRIVANLLHDLRKVSGGGAEMFWKGGFPGLAFETYPDVAGMGAEADIDSMRDQVHRYAEGTDRFLYSVGGSWKSLPPNIANPDGNLSWIVRLICCAINVPARIFMGSEAGHLASTKDDDAWRTRCGGRQTDYLEPRLLRPVIDRLMNLGCLPRVEEYRVAWRDLRALADKDRADITLKTTQAITQYATGGGPLVMPMKIWLTEVMGWSQERAEVVAAELAKAKPPAWALPQPTGPQGGPKGGPGAGRTGRPARGQTGRPAGQKPGQNGKGQGRPSSSSRGRQVNNTLKVRR